MKYMVEAFLIHQMDPVGQCRYIKTLTDPGLVQYKESRESSKEDMM
jgi:hypothetical protein